MSPDFKLSKKSQNLCGLMPTHPSLAAMKFASDAAGASFAKVNGRFILFTDQDGRGVLS